MQTRHGIRHLRHPRRRRLGRVPDPPRPVAETARRASPCSSCGSASRPRPPGWPRSAAATTTWRDARGADRLHRKRWRPGSDAVGPDFQFHLEIARATQNPHFSSPVASLGTAIDSARPAAIRRARRPEERASPTCAASTPSTAASSTRSRTSDGEAARAAMRTHLANSRERRRRAAQLRRTADPSRVVRQPATSGRGRHDDARDRAAFPKPFLIGLRARRGPSPPSLGARPGPAARRSGSSSRTRRAARRTSSRAPSASRCRRR